MSLDFGLYYFTELLIDPMKYTIRNLYFFINRDQADPIVLLL